MFKFLYWPLFLSLLLTFLLWISPPPQKAFAQKDKPCEGGFKKAHSPNFLTTDQSPRKPKGFIFSKKTKPSVDMMRQNTNRKNKQKPPKPSPHSLAHRIGYSFNSFHLQKKTLTRGHQTFQGELDPSRLQFLGAAIFNMMAYDVLKKSSPSVSFSIVHNQWQTIIHYRAHAELAKFLQLENDVIFVRKLPASSKGDKFFANLLRAVIGSAYLDGGYVVTYNMVERFVDLIINKNLAQLKQRPHNIANDTQKDKTKHLKKVGTIILNMTIADILMNKYLLKDEKALTQKKLQFYQFVKKQLRVMGHPTPGVKHSTVTNWESWLMFLGQEYLQKGYIFAKKRVKDTFEEFLTQQV